MMPCAGLAALLVLPACKKPQVQTYTVPNPIPVESLPQAAVSDGSGDAPDAAFLQPAAIPPASMPSAPQPPATGTPTQGIPETGAPVHPLSWAAPADWVLQADRPMRQATYTTPGGAELAITTFPGDVGGLSANINRWRTQLALAPLPDAEIVASTERMMVDGREAYLVNFAGTGSGQMAPMAGGPGGAPNPAGAQNGVNRTLGLILPYPEETWFFKLGGPDAAVSAQEGAFREFLATVHVHSEGDHYHHAPPAETSPAEASATAPRGSGPELGISIPTGWTVSPEKRAFRVATIIVPDPAGSAATAEISITSLEGAYGSLEENAERWWGELQRPAEEAPGSLQVSTLPGSAGLTLRLIDLNPPGAPEALGMLVGIVQQGNYAWFCKLKGPAQVVGTQKDTFTAFLQRLTLEPTAP